MGKPENPNLIEFDADLANDEGEMAYKSNITLRDLFAGLAMAGDMAALRENATWADQTPEQAALSYYEWADAMLQAREVE